MRSLAEARQEHDPRELGAAQSVVSQATWRPNTAADSHMHAKGHDQTRLSKEPRPPSVQNKRQVLRNTPVVVCCDSPPNSTRTNLYKSYRFFNQHQVVEMRRESVQKKRETRPGLFNPFSQAVLLSSETSTA